MDGHCHGSHRRKVRFRVRVKERDRPGTVHRSSRRKFLDRLSKLVLAALGGATLLFLFFRVLDTVSRPPRPGGNERQDEHLPFWMR